MKIVSTFFLVNFPHALRFPSVFPGAFATFCKRLRETSKRLLWKLLAALFDSLVKRHLREVKRAEKFSWSRPMMIDNFVILSENRCGKLLARHEHDIVLFVRKFFWIILRGKSRNCLNYFQAFCGALKAGCNKIIGIERLFKSVLSESHFKPCACATSPSLQPSPHPLPVLFPFSASPLSRSHPLSPHPLPTS